ncbi:MAG: response regulator [Armatimonadota bacterium]|nr:response regulator [Armatimonadota bacterium]MDR7450495.1 response regulator [Armatimonadota bacterium]MDR7466371.1 response regulator [Armatimonadota bacterium]MDR7493093.1 response regulator [Armatimonadota bacterium]MDR7498150.1 response regulator [Armatimonadota bacterium]
MTAGKRLLIVDDDPEFVEGIRGILEGAGYAVEAAYNPADGFVALRKGRFDLLLLDILMGRGAEGVMFARKMRKDPALRDIPVLIITGIREQIAFLFPGEPLHPHLVPVDELMEKPVEPALLLEKVAALLAAAERRKASGGQKAAGA